MTAIERGYGQDVHERKDDAQESRHQPEHVPVPHGWEQAADGSESAKRLGTVGREHILHVAHITCKHVPSIFHTCGERFEEAIAHMCELIIVDEWLHSKSELHLLGERWLGRERVVG